MGLVRGASAAATAARSEAVAAVWPDVHLAPMMRITITMITGIRRLSTFSGLVGVAGGVLVKLPPTSVSEGQALPTRALSVM
jgi:hypothetical protein